MADREISQLTAATSVGSSDLFVLEQNSTAKKLTGQTLINDLLTALDGHGGISSITWTTSGTSGDGQYHNGTITYADTTTSTFQFRDGVKGNTGDADHVYIKYSATQPTSNSDIGDTPDNWIGVYSGTASSAPTNYTEYEWFNWKGAKGDTGDGATVSPEYWYASSANVNSPPSSGWQGTIPDVPQGSYLWTKTILTFNDGTDATIYTKSRQGIDGEGQVDTVAANLADTFSDSETYDVGDLVLYNYGLFQCTTAVTTPAAWNDANWQSVTLGDVVDNAKPRVFTGSVTAATNATIMTISDSWITEDTIVVSCQYTTPAYVTSNVTWSSTAGSITFTGTATASTTASVILANKGN